jgi:hypothetical protein
MTIASRAEGFHQILSLFIKAPGTTAFAILPGIKLTKTAKVRVPSLRYTLNLLYGY